MERPQSERPSGEPRYPFERRAKIVATAGPACADEEMLRRLLEEGVDVVRLNLSHGTHDTHRQVIENLRKVANDMRRYVPIFADLMGPRYRLGQISDGPRHLAEDEEVTIGESGRDGIDLPVEDPDFLSHLQPGERVLLDNGLVELEVVAKETDRLRAKVVAPGPVSTRKGINLPDTDLPFTISKKDRADIAFAVEAGVEYIAVSFVGGPDDLHAVRKVVNEAGGSLPLIAKLERAGVMRRLKETVAAADAVMVARGDLGVEVPVRQVPIFQKRIITVGRRLGKPVIVATQMLESMMEHPRPTRAESSDVANAVFDGADALMLSGETAAGKFPVEAVQTMASVIKEAEAYRRSKPGATSLADDAVGVHLSTLVPGAAENLNPERDTNLEIPELIAESAVHATHGLPVRQLVAFSQGGFTARMIARHRPSAPLIVITPELRVARRVQLVWGARAMLMKSHVHHHDEVVEVVDRMLIGAGHADPGDVVIILMGDPIAARPLTNLMRVHRVRAPKD